MTTLFSSSDVNTVPITMPYMYVGNPIPTRILTGPVRGYAILNRNMGVHETFCVYSYNLGYSAQRFPIFEVGRTYELPNDQRLLVDHNGFHFCLDYYDCNYRAPFDMDNRYIEVMAWDYYIDWDRCVARKVQIVREISKEEWITASKISGRFENKDKVYYLKEGQYHREDGPAIEYTDGTKMWFHNGQRLNAQVQRANGDKEWYDINERLHREDGPTIERANGDKEWYYQGRLHREDGPAIERANGDKEWYRDGERDRGDGPAIEQANGDKEWYYQGRLHRVDGPAIERVNGNKEWYRYGNCHRDDGPARELINGDKEWFRDGGCHRVDGPAMELANGTKLWYYKGKLNRMDGPAIERANGDKKWFVMGNLHREDGPAVELSNGYKEWYLNDELHRDDGPAIEGPDGLKMWYQRGNLYHKDGPIIEHANGAKIWYLDGQYRCEAVPSPMVEPEPIPFKDGIISNQDPTSFKDAPPPSASSGSTIETNQGWLGWAFGWGSK